MKEGAPERQDRRAFLKRLSGVAAVGGAAALGGAAGSFAEKKLDKLGNPAQPDVVNEWVVEQAQIWQNAINEGDETTARAAMAIIEMYQAEVKQLLDNIATWQKNLVETKRTAGERAMVDLLVFQTQQRVNFLRGEIDTYSTAVENYLRRQSTPPEEKSDKKSPQARNTASRGIQT